MSSASQGLQSTLLLRDARNVAHALTIARNVLDRALGAPCAAAGFAEAVCDQPFRCALSVEPLGQRLRDDGAVWISRVKVEVLEPEQGGEERTLASVSSVRAQPLACG